MGCDGGTIPRRDELVKVKKKAETKDKDTKLREKWHCCAVSNKILKKPVVICGLGKMYNKLDLIQTLLDNSVEHQNIKHVKNLKNVKEVNLTMNPNFSYDDITTETGSDSKTAPFVCPIIGIEMSGSSRFIALWTCGCVMSEKAVKAMNAKFCNKCQKPFEDNDVVILHPNGDDLPLMQQRMEMRQSKRKVKSKSRTDTATQSLVRSKIADDPNVSRELLNHKVEQSNSQKQSSQQSTAPKRTAQDLDNDSSPSTSKLAKADSCTSKDPSGTAVYKSIFTTHQSEQSQTRAHWVTYNPFYN